MRGVLSFKDYAESEVWTSKARMSELRLRDNLGSGLPSVFSDRAGFMVSRTSHTINPNPQEEPT